MDKIEPIGVSLLILPKDSEKHTTDGGIELVNITDEEGTVVEVSKEMSTIYNVGDTIIHSNKTSCGRMYNGKLHIWLNGQGFPIGDIKAIIRKDD